MEEVPIKAPAEEKSEWLGGHTGNTRQHTWQGSHNIKQAKAQQTCNFDRWYQAAPLEVGNEEMAYGEGNKNTHHTGGEFNPYGLAIIIK